VNGLGILAKHRVNTLAVFLFMFWQTYAFEHLPILESNPASLFELIIMWLEPETEECVVLLYEVIQAFVSKAEIDDVLDLYSVVDPWNDYSEEIYDATGENDG
jgi:hypothetical protein